MKRFVPAFAVPLALALGFVQGDGSLPSAAPLVLVPVKPEKQAPQLYQLRRMGEKAQQYYQLRRSGPPLSGPGDRIPHSYTVYGLRTGPGGMAFTDRNGAILPVPSQPRLILGPPVGTRFQPYSVPRPAPKK